MWKNPVLRTCSGLEKPLGQIFRSTPITPTVSTGSCRIQHCKRLDRFTFVRGTLMSQCTDISTSSSSVSVMPGPEMLKNGFVGLCQQNASLQTAACKSKPLMETGRWRHPGQAGFKVAPGMCCFGSLQTFSVLQPPGPKKVQTF